MQVSCVVPRESAPAVPSSDVRALVKRRSAAVIVTERKTISRWVQGGFSKNRSDGDADGGSAVPVASDGYFLTADHVLMREKGCQIFVIYHNGKRFEPVPARIVKRSSEADLALLHIDRSTPEYYRWTPEDQRLDVGTKVIHGGISTSKYGQVGQLNTAVEPQRWLSPSFSKFKLDIAFDAGDSGGPVVDARGLLVGINSAVEYMVPLETPFFVDSEASRPNLRLLHAIIEKDRTRKGR